MSQVIDSQESQSHIPNPEPGGIVTSHAFKTEGSHQPQGDSDQQSIEAGSRLSSSHPLEAGGHSVEAGPSQHAGERMEPSMVGRTQDTASIEGEESGMVPHHVEDGIVDGSLTGPGGQYHHIESRPGQSGTAPPPGLASGSLESPVKKPEFSSELANLFSGANGDFPAGLQLPSVSELQLLLPGVIKDISQGGDTSYPQQVKHESYPTIL